MAVMVNGNGPHASSSSDEEIIQEEPLLSNRSTPLLDYHIFNCESVFSEIATLEYLDKLKANAKQRKFETVRKPAFLYEVGEEPKLPGFLKAYQQEQSILKAKHILYQNDFIRAEMVHNGEGNYIPVYKRWDGEKSVNEHRRPVIKNLIESIEFRIRMGDKRFAKGPFHPLQSQRLKKKDAAGVTATVAERLVKLLYISEDNIKR